MFQSNFWKAMAIAKSHAFLHHEWKIIHLNTCTHKKYSSFLFTNSGNNFYSKLDLCK